MGLHSGPVDTGTDTFGGATLDREHNLMRHLPIDSDIRPDPDFTDWVEHSGLSKPIRSLPW